MKPRSLTALLLVFILAPLVAHADELDALRKAGATMQTDANGFVSVRFAPPQPPRGPFGEPVFDPNFKPPPPVEEAQLKALVAIPKLHSLKLGGVALRPPAARALQLLSTARDLRSLDLKHMRGVNDEALSHLAGLTDLEALNLHDCRSVTNAGIKHLAGLKNLRVLDLRSTQVTDDGLAHLAQARALETLILTYTRVRGPGLAHLGHLPKLAVLGINPNRSTADKTKVDLSQLAEGFPALRALKVGGNHLDDPLLASVATVKTLQTLHFNTIGFTKFTDAGLAALANHPNLRELRLNGSVKLTNAGLHHLTSLPKLETLDLGRTNVNGEAVPVLLKMPALKTLDVVHLPFSPAQIHALRQGKPHLRVTLHRPLN